VDNTVVGNNVLVSNNTTTGTAPNDLIAKNTIGGNLTCVGNAPPPTDFGPPNANIVTGHKVGQCAGL
jgi:hypothetical protein